MAKKMGIISVNPMEYVKKPTEDNVAKKKKDIVFLTDDDMDRLYKECQRKNTIEYSSTGKPGTNFYSDIAYAIVLIMETGMRCGELLGIQYKHPFIKRS